MATTEQAKLLNQLKKATKGGWNKVRDTPLEGSIPGDIKRGIARMVGYTFKASQSGNPTFTIIGVIREPEEHEGKKCAGLKFYKHRAIYDSDRSTALERLEALSKDMQRLGVQTGSLDFDDILEAFEELQEQKPFFYFDTWQPKPDEPDNIVITIKGLARDYVDETPGDTTEEEAGPLSSGTAVTVDGYQDWGEWTGTVVSSNSRSAVITSDDDNEDYDVPLKYITAETSEEEEEDEEDAEESDEDTEEEEEDGEEPDASDFIPSVGDIVYCEEKEYKVTSVDTDAGTCEIEDLLDEGTVWEVEFSEVSAE